MKYYSRRSNSGKMSKVLFRIFFVICMALVIVIISALLGNYLKNKTADAEEAMKASGEAAGIQLSRENTDTTPDYPVSEFGMNACGIDLNAYAGTGDVVSAINSMTEKQLLIPICDKNGNLIYSSPALEKLTRHGTSEQSPDSTYQKLVFSSEASVYSGIISCAVLTPSVNIESPTGAAFIDNTIIHELFDKGIKKVLIKITSSTDLKYYKWIQSYITSLDFEKDQLGIALSSNYVLEPKGIQQLQLFSEHGAFLSVYFEPSGSTYETVYENVSHTLTSMTGMFELYTFTVLIDDNSNAAAIYQSCSDAGIEYISFMGDKPDMSEHTNNTVTDSDKSAETEQEKISNPYAGSSPSSENETEADNND